METSKIEIIIAALIGAAAFAILFRTPRRYFLLTTLIGALPLILLRTVPNDGNIGFGNFVAALLAGCMSHGAARLAKAPAQCFLIPSVILLVPGTYIYRAFNASLGRHFDDALSIGLTATVITLGISFGLLLSNWLFNRGTRRVRNVE
jgi:uncharacterized membrane protein YjjB (DUF3815 family)